MRLIIWPLIFFSVTVSFVAAKVIYTGKEEVVFLNTIETKNCFISYVTINGTTYLLKQKKDYKKQLAVVRDALAAYIAEKLNIAHQVDIIDVTQKFPGKVKSSWPATLHTIAPGETVRKQRQCKYNALRLRQYWAQAQTFDEKGITKSIIEHMTWHRQIPEIVALDLLIGNSDRHCGNLCYNPDTNTFCAIDMDDTFNKDLCLLAYEKLQYMLDTESIVFTKAEIRALTHMRNTLRFLMHHHRPQDIIHKLYFFAQKAGFCKGNRIYNDRIRKKLLSYEMMIIQSYTSAHKLVALLDKIVNYKFAVKR